MTAHKIILFCVLFFVLVHTEELKCSIPYLSLSTESRPLILDFEGSLFDSYTYGQIIVPHDSNITFSCMQNKIVDTKINKMEVTCVDGQLESNNKTFEYSEAACQKRVIELYSAISPECNGSLVIYHFYDEETNPPKLSGDNRIVPEVFENSSKIAETCFDSEKKIPIYTHFKISRLPIYLELHPNSTAGPKMPTMDLQITYVSDTLDKRVIKQLGHGNDTSILNDTLRVVSLVPHKLLHKQLIDASRRPHNLIGMWNSVKEGNWRNLLDDINNLNRRGRVFDIYMGTHKVLSLPNSDQNLTEVYLRSDETYPVPAYIWTVVYEPSEEAAAAFVLVNNNIYIDDLAELAVCNSICDQIYWIKYLRRANKFDKPFLGYMMCCDIRTFRDAVKGIPAIDELIINQEAALLRE